MAVCAAGGLRVLYGGALCGGVPRLGVVGLRRGVVGFVGGHGSTVPAGGVVSGAQRFI